MFDKKYFDDIWGEIGGIHRHDYCDSLANHLISQYGKVRFLDIGTGCGELVRVLREKGCIAFGIDVSEYAVANSHGNVLLGDVRDLPFKDNSFDVVHSNGLWGYFPKEDVAKAWSECLRVGKFQAHNIDYLDFIPEHKYLFSETKEWWDSQLVIPRILVTMPTHQSKEYAFQEWIDMAKSLTYPYYDILVVDNSPNDEYVKKYGDQVPMVHLDLDPAPEQWLNRICRSMAEAQRHFLKGNYTHWMNIEADNIPPSNVIETLLKYGGTDADWISHCYLVVPTSPSLQQGIGCSLLSRKLMTDFDWDDETIANDSPDAELWNWVQPRLGQYKVVELWGVMEVKHLK